MLAVWLREKHKLYCIYRFSNTLILSIGFILKIFLEFRKFQPQYSYKIYSWNGDVNCGNTNDRCSGNCNLSNCKVTRKQFRDFNGIRTHGPYIGSTPIELTKLAATYIIFFLTQVNGFWEENVMEPLSMLVPCSSLSYWRCCLRCAKRWSLCSALSCCPLFSSVLAMNFKSALSLQRSFSGIRGIPATCWIQRCHCLCMRNCSWFSECKHCLTITITKKHKKQEKKRN